MIAGIAREVIRRLRQDESKASDCASEKLITIETLDRHAGASQIIAADRAVVTPAAREEAQRRGIKITSGGNSPIAKRPVANQSGPDDSTINPLCHQLSRRGITMPANVQVIWVDQPAAEVFRRCSNNQRAVMINSLADVDRFAAELSPQIWVLDRHKLNLTAAVNVAARIARSAVVSGTTHANVKDGGAR